YTWPTRDGEDPVETLQLELLERVMRIELTDSLREQLGKAYSPAADSELSRVWRGYGTFAITASVNLADLAATRAAILSTLAGLRTAAVADDVLRRAREPLVEAIDNSLKTDRGWLALVSRAQSKPDRIDRQLQAAGRLRQVTGAQVLALAQRYLAPERAVEIDVVPAGATVP
ncbi:MAG TPA: insulinase family protein, partial [Novosphingobium sp.]